MSLSDGWKKREIHIFYSRRYSFYSFSTFISLIVLLGQPNHRPRWTKLLSFCFHCRHTSLLLLTRWKAMTVRVGKGKKHAWEFSRSHHRLFMEFFVWKKDLQLDENERKSVLWGIMDFPLPFFSFCNTYIVSKVRRFGQLSISSKRKRTKKDSFYFHETLTQEPSLLFGLARMDDDERSQVLWPSSKII